MNEKELERAMKNAEGSLALDGTKVTEEGRDLVRRRLLGKITEEEFLKQVMEMVKAK
ncbi:antitoxin VbhA family protein [Bacillus sp. MRMR6]|uniref:antitoxin VbhA family protein n=1 Tax=Bacillus sp. MRMR6 TaxID=1928617 RepID=UPI00158A5208|nr:antitoxin VbhA family protein [Bacillus sp. MRMR6]